MGELNFWHMAMAYAAGVAVGELLTWLSRYHGGRRPRQVPVLAANKPIYSRTRDDYALPATDAGCNPAVQKPIYYRTRDGRADYVFSIEKIATGSYRIYIVRQPDYGDRETDGHTTHRLHDGDRYYVCWTGTLATEEAARRVAALWADNTQEYIRTGRRF